MVTRWRAPAASSGVSRRGEAPPRSMPTSCMAVATSGCTRGPGSVPAEIARARAPSARVLKNAAAICDRPALWTHAKTTRSTGALSGAELRDAEAAGGEDAGHHLAHHVVGGGRARGEADGHRARRQPGRGLDALVGPDG